MSISLCMIVILSDLDKLDKCLNGVYKHVDEIILSVQDKGFEKIAKKYNAKVYQKDWTDNFAEAREHSFSKATKDWILWLDADDIVENPAKIKRVAEAAQDNLQGIVANYDYDHDRFGNVTINHWKLRMVKRESDFKWVGAIHENLMSATNASTAKTDDFNIVHKHADGSEYSCHRNMKIIEAELEKQKEKGEEIDPRLVYYMGITLKSMGVPEQAEKILREFVQTSGWDEQRYDAYLNLAQIGISSKTKSVAIDYALLALKERPDFPDAYFILGEIYYEFEEWEKGIEWILQGLGKKKIDTDWSVISRKPQALFHLSSCYTNLGKFKEANEQLEKLLKIWKKEKAVKKQIKFNNKLQREKDIVDSYFKIFKYLKDFDKKKYQPLIDSFPKTIDDNPALLNMKWKFSEPKQWEDNSIVIHCGESWEDWSPKIVSRGIGGSEEAVIYLSEELTRLGWKVTVFNSAGSQVGVHNGVTYRNHWEFNQNDKYNILIGWRSPWFFNQPYEAKKRYLWMHDVFEKEVFTKNVINNLDKVIVLSKYQRSLWPNIPEDKIFYSANGVHQENYDQQVARVKNKLIYASCPSRGLEILLDMWEDIRKEVPSATLNVFYGWGNWIKGNKNHPRRMQWMEQMKEKLKQEGITDHGRVGHKELAREYMSADVWAYPCIFPEISCISAMQAQIAGAIPVIVPYAALAETVQYGYKTKEKDAFKEGSTEEYKKLLIEALGADGWGREEMIKWAKDKYNWEKVGKEWSDEFSS